MFISMNSLHESDERRLGLRSSTWQHLRFPFSIFLAPVFLFAASEARTLHLVPILAVFTLLHFGVYPASNGYNSFYDQDEGPIGGVAQPKKPQPELLWVSNFLDGISILGLTAVNRGAGIIALIYTLASRAYSHPRVRIKGRPILGLLWVSLFQGAGVYWIVWLGIGSSLSGLQFDAPPLAPLLVSSLLLMGSYPLTQIYQHEEDARRGDLTFSRSLGVRGTFLFSSILSLIALSALSFHLFQTSLNPIGQPLILLLCMSPSLVFFGSWVYRVETQPSPKAPTHSDTMRMNILGSTGLSLFFLIRMFLL